MVESSQPPYDEAVKHGGSRSALRLVDAGEDPRVLSTNPDDFLKTPSVPPAALGFIALVGLSVLGVWFTSAAWTDDPAMPLFVNLISVILPWLLVGPFWVWWFRRQLRRPGIRQGRETVAALMSTAQPEQGRATWVSFANEEPEPWRELHVVVVVEAPGGDTVFVDAQLRRSTRRRPRFGVFGADGFDRFRTGDPVWIWRGANSWAFGQIARHGQDPTWSPAEEPQLPTWEELHDGHSPQFFVAELSGLAAQYRAGSLTLEEYEAAKNRLLGL